LDFKLLNATAYWEDFYDSTADKINNDLTGLFICYYQAHTALFIIFAFLIFLATLLCINISAISKIRVQQSLTPLRDIFKFTNDLLSSDFKRRQNLTQQQKRKSTTRFVRFLKPKNAAEEESDDEKR
jgi:hypothetical protein